MAVVTLDAVKAQLNIVGTGDDALIEGKIRAAQAHIGRLLGFSVEAGENGEWSDGRTPDDVKEGILQLAAHWYENREATIVGVGVQHLPYSVQEIVREYRNWSFG